MSEEEYILVYSLEDRRPACILLQAVMGGTVPNDIFYDLFPIETWLYGAGDEPAGARDRLQRFKSTREDLERVSVITLAAMAERG